MSASTNRLYNLLPAVYRERDAGQGAPLQALLQVISAQVDVAERDIAQLYDNWFIETCDDWVVPYVADLIGYQPVSEAGQPGDSATGAVGTILVPRREVANTIGYRRRKGTLALLERLAASVAGWPARVVEFDRRVSVTQSLSHLHGTRGRLADLRSGDALARLGGPFDNLSHTLDVRRASSARTPGVYNVPAVGLFVCRLRTHSVTHAPASRLDEAGDHCYTFSVLGNDGPLFNRPVPEAKPTDIAGELNLPTPIQRRAFEVRSVEHGVEHRRVSDKYYGEDKSVAIWAPYWAGTDPAKPIPIDKIVPADLRGWKYRPRPGHVAVDPERGRMAFPPTQLPEQGVWVSYRYGFGADIGGGEYERPTLIPGDSTTYRVGSESPFERIGDAYEQWRKDKPARAVIEISDSRLYEEQVHIEVGEDQTLEIRAANGVRPVIYLLDWRASYPDALTVTGAPGSAFSLDGILIAGRGIEIRGKLDTITIRHCTLVPGWALNPDCKARRGTEPSLALVNTSARIRFEHSIAGSIQVIQEEAGAELIPMRITDSILDATKIDLPVLSAPGRSVSPVVLTMARCTVLGHVHVHAIDLAENCVFAGQVRVGRRQIGCMRFCYVPPGSRTPQRYRCQPDLVDLAAAGHALRDAERLRVEPQFMSTRYGKPDYCRLAETCAVEIRRGADDQSELGVFHDLFLPQRAANLRGRLDEYVPAGMEAGIFYVT